MPSATNALSMAESCLASVPSLFTPKTQYPILSKSTLKLSLSSSSSSLSWVSLKHKSLSFRMVPLVAQTSDWAQEEDTEQGEEEGGLELEAQASSGEGESWANDSSGEGEAEKAVELFHRYDFDGRFLTVNKAAPRGSKPERRVDEASYRIYVGNLPWQVDDARLEQVFSEHGKVVNARVVYDRESGRSRGFGFVTMSSETELNDAIAALDGQSLDGRAIRVNVAEQRPRRNSFSF
ncbi:hypothetical protein TIFTF001_011840 [Ficus carica]|uniref:RRM domain-containing protein n=1 Tax=Ficus carica TaxID=3494 RepID=A0AA87ZZ12_FICCA|nr:hypothetical protein TIFTF001_011840 [Ficus carica]